jgi:hypothetical protein
MERYEIGHSDPGVICFCETFAEAEKIAKRNGLGTTLYDRMAHRGRPELWQVSDLGTLELIQRKAIA